MTRRTDYRQVPIKDGPVRQPDFSTEANRLPPRGGSPNRKGPST